VEVLRRNAIIDVIARSALSATKQSPVCTMRLLRCYAARNDALDGSSMQRIFTRENLMALALCVIVILVIIATTDSAPQWIYQGF